MITLRILTPDNLPLQSTGRLWAAPVDDSSPESCDLRVISSDVAVIPAAKVTWTLDVFGNAVAMATFQSMADNLVIESVVELQLDAPAWPVFTISASSVCYPFRYCDDEWIDLGALTI